MPPRCRALAGALKPPSTLTLTSQPASRPFTTTLPSLEKSPLARRKGGDLGSHLPKHVIPPNATIPPYPYGPARLFKQSDRGLYGGKTIHFGHNVSRKTETKTPRYWKPNVLSKSLYSVALKKKIKLRITSSVLKTVDREGGLDEYLLKESEARIRELGPLGWALRWTVMRRPSVVNRMREQAAALGVPQEDIDRQWPEPTAKAEAAEKAEGAVLDAMEGAEVEEVDAEQWEGLGEGDYMVEEEAGEGKEWDVLARKEGGERPRV